MTTIRNLSQEWWNDKLSWTNKVLLMKNEFKDRHPRDLTGREIENIFYQEIIVKWYDTKISKTIRNPMGFTVEGIIPKEMIIEDYIKEHTKEEQETIKSVTNCPTCGSECTIGGDSNNHFYVPKTSPTKEEVDVWDDEKWLHEILQNMGDKNNTIDLEAYARGLLDCFKGIKQHYTLIKKQ